MADGKIDVVLEDWQQHPLTVNQQYIEERVGRQRSARTASIGAHRLVHPDVPAEAVPAVQDLEGPEGQGEHLQVARSRARRGCSSAATRPTSRRTRQLIKALGLNFKHVVAGAEPAQVARWSQLYKQKKPVLFYWYTPQYLNAQYDLVRGASCRRAPRAASTRTTRSWAATPSSTSARTPYHLDKLFSGEVREERLAGRRRAQEVGSGRRTTRTSSRT